MQVEKKKISKLTRKNLLERQDVNQLTYVSRNQSHLIFAIACHGQLCQRPFEDQLKSFQSSYPYQSLLNCYHSNKKGKNP